MVFYEPFEEDCCAVGFAWIWIGWNIFRNNGIDILSVVSNLDCP